MDNTRIITYIKDGVLADALYEDGRMMELSLISQEKESILGNIYIGKVKNIVKNIQAAFVEIEHGMLCYLPLEDARYPVYTKPKKGKELAQILQETLNEKLDIARPREIKADNTYYILKRTQIPTVIAECGFLSNTEEAEKLTSEEYQEQVAEAVCEGILQYLKKQAPVL